MLILIHLVMFPHRASNFVLTIDRQWLVWHLAFVSVLVCDGLSELGY